MARRTTMGMWTTVLVVVKIQGNGGLNAGETNQEQYSDDEAVALPAFRHSHYLAEYTAASLTLTRDLNRGLRAFSALHLPLLTNVFKSRALPVAPDAPLAPAAHSNR